MQRAEIPQKYHNLKTGVMVICFSCNLLRFHLLCYLPGKDPRLGGSLPHPCPPPPHTDKCLSLLSQRGGYYYARGVWQPHHMSDTEAASVHLTNLGVKRDGPRGGNGVGLTPGCEAPSFAKVAHLFTLVLLRPSRGRSLCGAWTQLIHSDFHRLAQARHPTGCPVPTTC